MTSLINFDYDSGEFTLGELVAEGRDHLGKIQVIDYGKQRVLSFDDAHEQSRIDLSKRSALVHDYTRAMLLGQIFSTSTHATILGLGGGCLVRALRNLDSQLHISAVELRQAVADIAEQYFGLPDDSRFLLNVVDAQSYLEQQPDGSTDIIYADLFHAFQIDSYQTSKYFVRHCQRVLSDDGWLIINFHQLPDIESVYFKCLQAHFDHLAMCAIDSDNYIVYAGKQALSVSAETLEQRLGLLQSRLHTRLDLLYRSIVQLQRSAKP